MLTQMFDPEEGEDEMKESQLPKRQEPNAMIQMPDISKVMAQNQDMVVQTLKEAKAIFGKAAGEIQAIFNKKCILHPDGRYEFDNGTIVNISKDPG